MTTTPLQPPRRTRGSTRVDPVFAWRRERLMAVGFDEETAALLAGQRGVDLHAVLALVARGCPPHLAARIMDTGVGPHA